MSGRHPTIRNAPGRLDDGATRSRDTVTCSVCGQSLHFPTDRLLIGRTMVACGCDGGRARVLVTRTAPQREIDVATGRSERGPTPNPNWGLKNGRKSA